MTKYIDMHCHILPGIDDGAKDINETIKMLKAAYAEGIRYIVATPHFHPGRGRASCEEIRKQLRYVREEARKIDEKFKIFCGQEIYFGQDVPGMLRDKKLMTLNSNNVCLIEFSPSVEARDMIQSIQQLQICGLRVVLAHVERYCCLRDDDRTLVYLLEMGVLFQVNAGSITGKRGREIKKFVGTLLAEEKVFCVGTDAHDSKKRPPEMKKAALYVEKNFGKEYARRIFFSNAVTLLKKQK